MEKIVYVLGAGFSAPLGLPVMSNFLEKSKDMYFNSPKKYNDFEAIFEMVKEIAYLKNFINSDLHNIEEILSILEMGYFVGDNTKTLEKYKEFLKEVIAYYTPSISFDRQKQNETNWNRCCFGENRPLNYYGWFIANLFQIKLCQQVEEEEDDYYYYTELGDTYKNVEYGIITLNYDLVVENIVNFINQNYKLKGMELALTRTNYDNTLEFNKIKIAKLHGCLTSNIIPPTWNKNGSNNNMIQEAWKLAYEMLKDANQIRIIGYSMPISDSYIKYLLAVAFKNFNHMKKIDVITLDSDHKTEQRYKNLFTYPKFRFKHGKFENFLEKAFNFTDRLLINKDKLNGDEYSVFEIPLYSSIIEEAHERFMTGN